MRKYIRDYAFADKTPVCVWSWNEISLAEKAELVRQGIMFGENEENAKEVERLLSEIANALWCMSGMPEDDERHMNGAPLIVSSNEKRDNLSFYAPEDYLPCEQEPAYSANNAYEGVAVSVHCANNAPADFI